MKNWVEFHCDDWVAVYIDDILVHDDHKITTEEIFNLCSQYGHMTYQSIYIDEDIQEKYELWDFPRNINSLPKEILKEIENSS